MCCGKPMELLIEKSNDVGHEKHVPVIDVRDDHISVKIGSIPHPMEEEHYIEWVELITENMVWRIYLKPNDESKVVFPIRLKKFKIRIYCNLHGLWTKSFS